MQKKIPVGILGATGSVGQRFIQLLSNHPWFEITAIAASERSAGKSYQEAVTWLQSTPIPAEIAKMPVLPCLPNLECRLVFSGLDSSVAEDIEKAFAEKGYIVVSNARNFRMNADVPLLVPEVNAEHLSLIKHQKFDKGAIITNPNCSAVGLVLALKPIYECFGLESVHVVTMQAISGAGYPGLASLEILDNVIPFIKGEEEKLETEPLKILGKYENGKIIPAHFKISAQCNRVAVTDGHTESVSVKLWKKTSPEEIIETWKNFSGKPQDRKLPSAPYHPIHYYSNITFPQPKLHRDSDKGMAVSIGRLRPCSVFDYKFTLLSHNTIRGAAGSAILNAEMLVSENYF